MALIRSRGTAMGPISRFLADDHRRLEALLDQAAAVNPIDVAVFEQFRAGLLRHIGMEERVPSGLRLCAWISRMRRSRCLVGRP